VAELTRQRSSTLLKDRLLEAHRAEPAVDLGWAEADTSLGSAAALVTGPADAS